MRYHSGVAQLANAAAGSKTLRKAGEALFGLHQDAPLPHFSAKALTKQLPPLIGDELPQQAQTAPRQSRNLRHLLWRSQRASNGRRPDRGAQTQQRSRKSPAGCKVLRHAKTGAGRPEKVEKMKDANIPVFTQAIAEGYDIIAPIPSCVLMYKQELPLMFPTMTISPRLRLTFLTRLNT